MIFGRCTNFFFLSYPLIHFVISIDLETNECLQRNGGCWQDNRANITACKVYIFLHFTFIVDASFYLKQSLTAIDLILFCQDTFRGRVCECPVVDGVQYKGDGYTSCAGKTFSL